MLYALAERGIHPARIVGTSVGAINGAFLASRSDLAGVAEIARFWSSLRRRDVLGINLSSLLQGLLRRRDHFFDSGAFRRILDSFLGFSRLEDAPVPLAVVATALTTGEPVVLETGDAASAVLASSAVPGVLPPVEVGGRLLVDGAAAADVPLEQALELGGRDLYVLPTAPLQVARIQNLLPPSGAEPAEDSPRIRIVAPPELHVPFGDLSQSPRLLEVGYERGRAWLDGEPDQPSSGRCARSGRRRPARARVLRTDRSKGR